MHIHTHFLTMMFFFIFIDAFILASNNSAFHGVMYNPAESRVIATANAKDGAGLWDVRKPRQ